MSCKNYVIGDGGVFAKDYSGVGESGQLITVLHTGGLANDYGAP